MDLLFGRKPANKPTETATAAGTAAALVYDATTASFEQGVIAASMQLPVIVDFWAPWCAPCKQLGPLLEKAVAAAGGAVRMAKVNIDENPELAQALRIQSVPTVYAFFQGRPVDGFMGAVPESQIKGFISKLLALSGGGANPINALLEQAKEALELGQTDIAQEIYAEILDAEPAEPMARAGLARLALTAGDVDAARAILAGAPPEIAKHAEIVAAGTALDLAGQGKGGASRELAAKLQADPADHATRFDLAMAHYAEGNRESAVDELLDIVRRDRAWNEEGARKQLVKLFEAFGPVDPLTVSARKRLSSILFS